jgi:hypothetical protein
MRKPFGHGIFPSISEHMFSLSIAWSAAFVKVLEMGLPKRAA